MTNCLRKRVYFGLREEETLAMDGSSPKAPTKVDASHVPHTDEPMEVQLQYQRNEPMEV